MKRRNRIIILGLFFVCVVCLTFTIYFYFIRYGLGFLEAFDNEREMQRSYIKKTTLKGTVSHVTDTDVLIKIDTISNYHFLLPMAYIPAYEFQFLPEGDCLILKRKRLKLYNVKKGNNVKKNAETDSIIIGRDTVSLFDRQSQSWF